jgi:hypothetical protein
MKLKPFPPGDRPVGYMFYCPGCGFIHAVTVHPNQDCNGSSWLFNENLELPTFEPSILARLDFGSATDWPPRICHIYLVDGRIHYLAACTHELVGQVVDVPEWPEPISFTLTS